MARFPVKNFKPTGYRYDGLGRLIEIQVNHIGEAARYKITQHFSYGMAVYYGYWQEICFDRKGMAFIRDWSNYRDRTPHSHSRLYLHTFIKTQPVK